MKIALLTANIGGIDHVRTPIEQVFNVADYIDLTSSASLCPSCSQVQCDYHCFTESNLPYPLPHLSPRLQGKYVKILTHRFMPSYDVYVWIDGRIEITDKAFVAKMVDKLGASEVVIAKHNWRLNVYDEIDFILDKIRTGDEYLVKRYGHEPFDDERMFYLRERLPKEVPLYTCAIFARRNEPRLNRVFEDWWLRSLEFTLFDQAMFSFVAWKHKLKLFEFNSADLYGGSVIIHKHISNV